MEASLLSASISSSFFPICFHFSTHFLFFFPLPFPPSILYENKFAYYNLIIFWQHIEDGSGIASREKQTNRTGAALRMLYKDAECSEIFLSVLKEKTVRQTAVLEMRKEPKISRNITLLLPLQV